MLPESLSIEYRTHLAPEAASALFPSGAVGVVPCINRSEVRVKATLGPEVLQVEEADGQFAMTWDPLLDRQLMVEHRRKGFAVVENTRELVDQIGRRAPSLRPDPGSAGEVVEVQGAKVRTRAYVLEIGGFVLHLSALPAVASHADSVQRLWHWLVPLGGEVCRALGVPYRIRMRDPASRASDLVRLEAVSFVSAKTASADLTPPAGYENLHADRQGLRDLTAPTPSPGPRRAEQLPRAPRRGSLGGGFGQRRHALRGSTLDFAWLARQAALDQVRDVINAVSRSLGSFHGDSDGDDERMHVMADWWDQLRASLDFGPHHAQVLEGIKLLLLYRQVSMGEELVSEEDQAGGLTSDEQQEYQEDVLAEAASRDQSKLPEQGWRVQLFQAVFGSRSLRIAEAQFEQMTRPRRINLGPERLTQDEVAGLVDFEAWDFDTDLTINHRDVVQGLRFEQDRLRAEVTLEQIRLRFRFRTLPALTTGSIVCNMLSFGLCTWLLQLNYGWGWFSMNDLRLTFDVEPEAQGDRFGWSAALDREASNMGTNLLLIGVNPIQDLILLIYSAVASMFNLLSENMLDELEDAVDDALDDVSWLSWADIWNASYPPPGKPLAVALVPGHGAWQGRLEDTLGLPGATTPIEPGYLNSAGYLFSERYLTAWLTEFTSVPEHAYGLDPSVILTRLGITLPPPESASEPDRADDGLGGSFNVPLPYEGCDPPPAVAPARKNRLGLVRSRPRAVFPEAPQPTVVDHAGRVELVYEVSMSAVEQKQIFTPLITPSRCHPVAPGQGPHPPGPQPGPGPLPPLARHHSGLDPIRRLAAWAAQVPKTAGERERFERAVGYLADGRSLRPAAASHGMDPGLGTLLPSLGGATGPSPNAGDTRAPARSGPMRVGGGGFPPPWPPGPGARPGEICEPPHCQWQASVQETPLHHYLRARIRVTGELLVGFDPYGSYWLPQIILRVKRDRRRRPQLEATVERLERDAPFDQVSEAELRDVLEEIALEDARLVLADVAADPVPKPRRRLVPPEVGLLLELVAGDAGWTDADREAVRDQIQSALVFEQQAGDTALQYLVHGDLLYWPFQTSERLTQWLA